jgi:2-(1,2-epoxy-1,2-dihydrophenyl)acetyl-CoA isomerase
MGLAKSMGTALFADKVFARDACSMGMIWEAVADEKFVSHWKSRAAHLAAGPTLTYGHIKTAIRSSFTNSEVEQLDLEARLQGDCGHTRDFKEGVTAFLDKRTQKFEGR